MNQGDLQLLDDPVAKELLAAPLPAHLAYSWTDGTPRVVPIWFHWTGDELVMATPPNAPKNKALAGGTPVAVTIDSTDWPYHVLMLRGRASVSTVDGVVPEYAEAAKRYFGDEQGTAWVAQFPEGTQMTRVALRPEWAAIVDFETRLPSALAQ